MEVQHDSRSSFLSLGKRFPLERFVLEYHGGREEGRFVHLQLAGDRAGGSCRWGTSPRSIISAPGSNEGAGGGARGMAHMSALQTHKASEPRKLQQTSMLGFLKKRRRVGGLGGTDVVVGEPRGNGSCDDGLGPAVEGGGKMTERETVTERDTARCGKRLRKADER